MVNDIYVLLICTAGIYSSFLTWALVQEPLTTKIWPNSQQQFQYPNVIAISQASVAMIIGYAYLRFKGLKYSPWRLCRDHSKSLFLISFTQSTANPLATYSLQYVDYLTYMLAKSCKMIPVLLVHLLVYHTSIANEKKIVATLVSLGVAIFTYGGSMSKKVSSNDLAQDSENYLSLFYGFSLLLASLFLDGMTNATQDKMLKANKAKKDGNIITASHLMFILNLLMIIWNLGYFLVADKSQITGSLAMLSLDPDILRYLLIYSICGAVGQCFIFFTLERYGSLVLITITVTRKMMSMLLSIVVYGKSVNMLQWLGIFIVFGGISWEALNKTKQKVDMEKKSK
ncbi:hypothetical protein NCAS_0G01150 [Naumovozyma castellii]|uniref:UDP-galactose transporter homolog 1 n=1 Tax=Naumovozyma castellii TaxID=27288 RepID=G0VHW8_NAUCA|nr:hypothetical protein NCAS_0G01150 [Naumovozyma castellii CBS 4309]CCC71002.1 hypothetical protein NCAS_0G01150 [Naumovozyma castellii CBS 4309]